MSSKLVLSLTLLLGLAIGCSKTLPALLIEHEAGFAHVDALLEQANAEVGKVPERGHPAPPVRARAQGRERGPRRSRVSEPMANTRS